MFHSAFLLLTSDMECSLCRVEYFKPWSPSNPDSNFLRSTPCGVARYPLASGMKAGLQAW